MYRMPLKGTGTELALGVGVAEGVMEPVAVPLSVGLAVMDLVDEKEIVGEKEAVALGDTVTDAVLEGVPEFDGVAEAVTCQHAAEELEFVLFVIKLRGQAVQAEKAVPFANVFSGHTAQDVLPCPD